MAWVNTSTLSRFQFRPLKATNKESHLTSVLDSETDEHKSSERMNGCSNSDVLVGTVSRIFVIIV
jgi:hypothetical protein